MTNRNEFETAALGIAQTAMEEARGDLAARRISVGGLELVRSGEGDAYESELRKYGFKDGQICDALEDVVWSHGRPTITLDELRLWLQAELASLARRRL